MGDGMHTALVVEDDQGMLDVLCEVLTDAGFTTSCHPLGRPAMRALGAQRFDVIVTDVNLPDMNGLKLCEVAREQYGDQAIILVVTGADIERRIVTSLQLGADAFLEKPFDVDELIARIERIRQRMPVT